MTRVLRASLKPAFSYSTYLILSFTDSLYKAWRKVVNDVFVLFTSSIKQITSNFEIKELEKLYNNVI